MEKHDEKKGYKETLVIIDGKSVFYFFFYAMGNLAKSDGTPTSGVYGFAPIAMEIVSRLKPDKVVVAWDKARTSTSKRKAIFADYKAGRVKPPEDFYAQIPLLIELISALGWGFMECDDFEADDIIGTLVKQADDDMQNGKSKWMTYIVSSDLDMLQIVDENTKMYRLLKGFSKLEEIDVAAVEAKYGILKNQFLDLKAIKGDNSDNIPGVLGIGEKGAVKLLNEYGSLDGIYNHIDQISGSVHDKLVAGKASAEMSYKLSKIMFDAPVKLSDVPNLVIIPDRIISELEKLEFSSLIRKYKEQLDGVALRHNEDKVFEPMGISNNEGDNLDNAEVSVPQDLLIENDVKQRMHSDQDFADTILSGAKYWDLTQAEFLINPLERISDDNLLMELPEEKKKKYQRQIKAFAKMPKLEQVYYSLDLPLIPILYKMETKGAKIDKAYFKELKKEFTAQIDETTKKIFEVAGEEFNINSPIQLSRILFEKLGLSIKGIKKTARGYSTGAKERDKLAIIAEETGEENYKIVPLITEYRERSEEHTSELQS